jgi:hypothetical protein
MINTNSVAFPHLQGHKYMALTTFRKNGQPVPTPVWFAQVDDRLYVVTQATSGKVKRIRSNAQVEVTPCTVNGTLLGSTQEAMARILTPAEGVTANQALNRKYGVVKWLFELTWKLRRVEVAFLEITSM